MEKLEKPTWALGAEGLRASTNALAAVLRSANSDELILPERSKTSITSGFSLQGPGVGVGVADGDAVGVAEGVACWVQTKLGLFLA